MSDLSRLGWTPARAAEFAPHAATGCLPARIARPERSAAFAYVGGADDVVRVELSAGPDRPTVGDWVALRPGPPAIVAAVLTRTSSIVRHGAAAATAGQVLAANVDVVFLAVALHPIPNLRRLERLLALAWESGAQPVVLLTKSDLCDDVTTALERVRSAALGVDVHALSVPTGEGLGAVSTYLCAGRTSVLLGASGAGKSTLANHLLGADHLVTRDIRDDGKGRHTTTHRKLLPLPGGGVLIDTPGLRGVQLWDAEAGVEAVFADIEALVAECRFSDCAHDTEPGCAVLTAVGAGRLDSGRLRSWRKLQRELAHLARRQDVLAHRTERQRWKDLARTARARARP